MSMNENDLRIKEEILKTSVGEWLEQRNPFSDTVFKEAIMDEVLERIGDDVERNDVEYVWKLMTEDGYFRKRGRSRRITAKEIDEAQELGIDTPLNPDVQEAILQVLAEVERADVSHPEVSRDDLIQRLDYDEAEVDYNLFYCRSKGWADVGVYISNNPWEHAEITRFGRDIIPA